MKTIIRVIGISLMWLSLVRCDNAPNASSADNDVDLAGEEAPLGIPANDNVIYTSNSADQLNVLSYNIYGINPPFGIGAAPAIDERFLQLPSVVGDYDVVIWSEAFDDGPREALQFLLRLRGFVFHTAVVDTSNPFTEDGGVFISSKWPIVEQDQRVYSDACVGEDCLSEKGVSYAKIVKSINGDSQIYHIFGTHLQATTTLVVGAPNPEIDRIASAAARRDQLRQLQAFIFTKSLLGSIQPGEPVIIGGDMNIDRYTEVSAFLGEYEEMLSILNATDPNEFAWRETEFSWYPQDGDILDPNINWLASPPGSPELLDYVLYSKGRDPLSQFETALKGRTASQVTLGTKCSKFKVPLEYRT